MSSQSLIEKVFLSRLPLQFFSYSEFLRTVKPALLIRLVELVLGWLDSLGRTDSKISFLFKNRSRNDKILSLLKGVSLAF